MPPELGELVLRAHELLDQGLVRYALLEAATLAELAVEEYLKERVKRDKGRLMAIQQFWELPLRAKLVIVATLAEIIEAQEIDSAVQAISLRNEIVHEGKEPPENAGGLARSLIQLSAKLVFGEEYKMPSAWIGNKLFKDDRS
jgi:hypothetical protein